MISSILKSNKGMAMILAMLVGVIGMIFGITLWHIGNADAVQVKKSETKAQSYFFVQSGLELAMGHILNNGIDYLLDEDTDDCLTSDVFYGDLEHPDITNAPAATEVHNLEFKISRHEDKSEGVADEDYDHYDDYFIIESKGIVRKSDDTEFTIDKMNYKVYVRDLFYRITRSSGGNPSPLDMVFSLEGINLLDGGSSEIHGNTGTNSSAQNSVRFAYSTILRHGNLYIGPDVHWEHDEIVQFTGDGRGPTTNIPDGGIFNLDHVRNYPMPVFPDPPFDTAEEKDPINAGWWPIPEGGHRINASGKYSYINVENSLTIDIGNEDVIIQTRNLNITDSGKIKLNKSGSSTGRLILFVTENFTLTGSSTVNQGGDYNDVYMYYSGNQDFDIGGDTKFNGSVYALNSNIIINGSGGFLGNIITGGAKVEVTGNAEGNVRVIYAPNATLKLTGSGHIRGVSVTRSVEMTGNTRIYSDSNINSDFFDQLQWDTEPGGGGPGTGHEDQIDTGFQDGSWRKKVTVEP